MRQAWYYIYSGLPNITVKFIEVWHGKVKPLGTLL